MGLFRNSVPNKYTIEEKERPDGKTEYTICKDGHPTFYTTFQRKLAEAKIKEWTRTLR